MHNSNLAMPPRPAGEQPRRITAAIGHLSGVIGCVVAGPLIAWLVYRSIGSEPERGFARDAAREALNFQITVLLFVVPGLGVAWLIGMALSTINDNLIVIPTLIGICGAIVLLIVDFAWGITAAIRTGRGDEYRYPLALRLVPDR